MHSSAFKYSVDDRYARTPIAVPVSSRANALSFRNLNEYHNPPC